jgi:hypothetical protein
LTSAHDIPSPEVRALLRVSEKRQVVLPVPDAPYPDGAASIDPLWQAEFRPDLTARQWSQVLLHLVELQLLHSNGAMMHIGWGLTPMGTQVAATLNAKLGRGFAASSPFGADEAYATKVPSAARSIFISHSHADNEFCARVDADLKLAGFQTWFDLNDLMPGDSLVEKIDFGLRNSQSVLIVYSKHAAESS